MKNKKRTLITLLIICVVFLLTQISVFADDTIIDESDIPESGVTYTLTYPDRSVFISFPPPRR